MPDTKPRFLVFRRAVWFAADQAQNVLSDLVGAVLDRFPEKADTRYSSGTKRIDIRHSRRSENQIHLHISQYADGEHASTVKKDHVEGNETLGKAPPPADADYLDKDAFVLIEGSCVLICANGMREPTIGFYLQYLTSLFDQQASNFSIERVPMQDKVEQLLREGVKAIDLDISDYNTKIDAMNHAAEKWPQRLARVVRAVIEEDQNAEQAADAALVMSRITYTYDGRLAGTGTQQVLTNMALEVIEEMDSGFTIHTAAGNQITQSEVSIRKTYQIKRDGKSLVCDEAWSALDDFAQGLKSTGKWPA